MAHIRTIWGLGSVFILKATSQLCQPIFKSIILLHSTNAAMAGNVGVQSSAIVVKVWQMM
ncbi:MAG: hypothetical protein CM15mP102_13830 [Flavobacteriales bacterium]|nr:MAG: hypothetical protein CM15mP102_13830 [Flavobacteriales bacterium]